MNDIIKIDYIISSCIYTIRKKYSSIDIHNIMQKQTFLQKTLLEYFESITQLSKQANTATDLQISLANLETFAIEADIEIEIDQWVAKLVSNIKDGDVHDHVNTYLCLYNKNYFDMFTNKISMDGIASIWSASSIVKASKRRFLAMLILYFLTRAFAKNIKEFSSELQSVEGYFVIRNYLLYGNVYDLMFYDINSNEQFEQPLDLLKLETLKSMFTLQELSLLSTSLEQKAITAAGGIAQSIEREDLEGSKKKKNKKSVKKRYNRIEKLEED